MAVFAPDPKACRPAPAAPLLRNLPGKRLLLIDSLNSGLVFNEAGSPEGPLELALKETFGRFRNAEQLHELGSNPFNASYCAASRCSSYDRIARSVSNSKAPVVLESDSL